MNEQLSGDLFAIDKRLSLKGIKDLNKYLEDAFLPGACTCSRCKENDGIEQDYEFDHTFSIGGSTVRRVFSCTSASDVQGALRKAWKAYTKTELGATDKIDKVTVEEFVEPQWHQRLWLLALESRAAKIVDGEWYLLDCSE